MSGDIVCGFLMLDRGECFDLLPEVGIKSTVHGSCSGVALDPTEAARQELDRQRIGSGFRPPVVRRQGCVPLVGRWVKMGCGSSKTVKSGTNQVFCIVGPPCSFKSVLCETLSKHHGYGYVTLGEAQRRCVRLNSEIGPSVKKALDDKIAKDKEARKAGKPVNGWAGTDTLNAQVLHWQFTEADQKEAENGWLIDGFPTTKAQASMLQKNGVKILKAVVVKVDDEVLAKLATGRRMDLENTTIYHIDGWGGYEKPPDDPTVQERLQTRDDDAEEMVQVRLADFHKTYDAVTKLFQETYEIDGNSFITDSANNEDKLKSLIEEHLLEFLRVPLEVPEDVRAFVEDLIEQMEADDEKEEGPFGLLGVDGLYAPAPESEDEEDDGDGDNGGGEKEEQPDGTKEEEPDSKKGEEPDSKKEEEPDSRADTQEGE